MDITETKISETVYVNYKEDNATMDFPWKTKIILAIFLISALLPLLFLVSNIPSVDADSSWMKKAIVNKYPSQNRKMLKNLFGDIKNFHESTDERDKALAITVLYSHKTTAECFVNDVAEYIALLLRQNTDFLRLNGSLVGDDFSSGNKNFVNSVEKKGVLVVYNFHELSPKVVKHFHAICDTYSPYVNSKAIYLILLELGQVHYLKTPTLMRKVIDRVSEIWCELEKNLLDPLIVRLSENIIEVEQENSCC